MKNSRKERKKWTMRPLKVKTGYLVRYASLVTSGYKGAILDIPVKNI